MNVLHRDTFKKNIPSSILVSAQKLAKANAVRELEATAVGQYTAFVDDKKQSFDVKLVVDSLQNVVENSCDCSSKALICEHIVAAYLALIKKHQEPTIRIVPKKRLLSDEVSALNSEVKKKRVAKDLTTINVEELDFEQYQKTLQLQASPELAKKWRQQFINNIIKKRKLNNRYTLFLFDLLGHENDFDKMIDLVDDYTSFELTISCFDSMYAHDKIQLLKNILSKTNTVLYDKRKMIYTDKSLINRMITLITRKYTKEEIRVVINSLKFIYRSSELRSALENKLFPKNAEV